MSYVDQRLRDLMKAGLGYELGHGLIVITAKTLSVSHVGRVLGESIALPGIPEDRWHVVDWLEEKTRQYRARAQRKEDH